MNKNDKKNKRGKKGLVNPKNIKEFSVYKKTTLMEFLVFKMPDTPRKTIKSLLSHHQVAVGGVPVSKFDYPLVEEDVVTISKYRIAKHERKSLPIIYEDDDLIAIDKPSGLLSVATDTEKGRTAYRLVSDYLAQKDKNARAYVVHRLDEDTSGVLLFAKKAEVRDILQNQWGEIVKKRGYYAVVEGFLDEKGRTLKDYLAQDNFQLIYVTKNKSKGKLAITNFKTVKATKDCSLLDINIETGRKNQIRVQLGNIGHYVLGDDKYGEPADPIKRLALHAYELDFFNPISKKKICLHAPMPKQFKDLVFEKQKEEAKQAFKKKGERKPRVQTKMENANKGFKAYKRRMSNGQR